MNKSIFTLTCSIVLSIVIITSVQTNAFAEITLRTYDSEIDQNDSMLILGHVDGLKFYKQVTISIYDPSGKLVYSPSVPFDGDGNFQYLAQPTLPYFEPGVYVVKATHQDLKQTASLEFTVKESATNDLDTKIIPEFGIMSALILVVSMSAILVISTKFRKFGIPKI